MRIEPGGKRRQASGASNFNRAAPALVASPLPMVDVVRSRWLFGVLLKARIWGVVVVSGVMLLCGACEEPATSSIYGYSGLRNTCNNDSNCSEGFCHPSKKVCVITVQSEEEMYARVTFNVPQLTPQTANTDVPQLPLRPQVFKVPLASAEDYVIELQNPVPVQNLYGISDVAADILFFDLSNSLPGQDPNVTTYKTYIDATNTTPFYMLPGRYDIAVYPVGEQKNTHPVSTLKEIEIDAQGLMWSASEQLATVLPDPGNLLTGKVYYFSSVEGNIEARDLSVQAYDSESGAVLSHSFALSCLAGSNPLSLDNCGNFSIPLLAQTQSVELHFFKPNEPFFPAYVHTIDKLAFSNGVASAQIILPPLEKPVLVTGRVAIDPVPDGITPPPICRVLFERLNDSAKDTDTDTVADKQLLEYWVNTNGYGEIERGDGLPGVYLYPGRYQVTVIPTINVSSTSQTYARTELPQTLVVTRDETALPKDDEDNTVVNQFFVTLTPRLKITGTVTYNKMPIPGAWLTANNVGGIHPYSNQLTTQADDNAQYTIWVDREVYLVIANPPTSSGFVAGFNVWKIPQSKTFEFATEVQVPFLVGGTVNLQAIDAWFRIRQLENGIPEARVVPIKPEYITMEWYRQFGQATYLANRNSVQPDTSFTVLLSSGH